MKPLRVSFFCDYWVLEPVIDGHSDKNNKKRMSGLRVRKNNIMMEPRILDAAAHRVSIRQPFGECTEEQLSTQLFFPRASISRLDFRRPPLILFSQIFPGARLGNRLSLQWLPLQLWKLQQLSSHLPRSHHLL